MINTVRFCTRARVLSYLMLITLVLCSSWALALSNEDCMDCHGDHDLTTEQDGKTISLYMDAEIFGTSVHAENGCVSCHEEAEVDGDEHPFPMTPVNCEGCHDEIGTIYEQSAHGMAVERKDAYAPKCQDCHSRHAILPATSPKSTTYPLNIPYTCGRCHREGSSMTSTHDLGKHNIIENYSMSIHGKGLFRNGLIVTAVCSSCHSAHNVQKATHPESTVNRDNIIETCNQCHVGIVNTFKNSVHSPSVTQTDKKLPVCIDCHNSHTIAQVDNKNFRLIIAKQCSNCHEHETESYFETYHGRASMLRGGEKTAKCSDCHGSHNIMPAQDATSMINTANIVQTCAKCHPKANLSFTTYLPHASHNDRENYPYLFYTFWAMTGLLLGTFGFFGLHTILWVPRSIIERIKMMAKGGH